MGAKHYSMILLYNNMNAIQYPSNWNSYTATRFSDNLVSDGLNFLPHPH